MFKKLNRKFIAIIFGMVINTGVSHGLEFGIFSDITVGDSTASGANSQFVLGALDFYATTKIDDDTRVFIEYVFENTRDGLVTDLERLWITRTFNDAFSVGVGRFHSPLGTWNRTYHHGAILQDTVSRPFFLDFEDGEGAILPTHIVGLLATGNITLGMGDLDYELYVANGPSLNTENAVNGREIEINGQGDPNGDKSIGFRSTLNLSSIDFSFSIFGMFNTIAESSSGGLVSQGNKLITQTIGGVDLFFATGDFDLLAEFYVLQNKDEVGSLGTQKGGAFYTQLGYQLAEKWKLVVRHEQIMTKENGDRYFKELGTRDMAREVAAVRYDLDDTNSLKFEVSYTNPDDGNIDAATAYTLQWAFMVP